MSAERWRALKITLLKLASQCSASTQPCDVAKQFSTLHRESEVLENTYRTRLEAYNEAQGNYKRAQDDMAKRRHTSPEDERKLARMEFRLPPKPLSTQESSLSACLKRELRKSGITLNKSAMVHDQLNHTCRSIPRAFTSKIVAEGWRETGFYPFSARQIMLPRPGGRGCKQILDEDDLSKVLGNLDKLESWFAEQGELTDPQLTWAGQNPQPGRLPHTHP